MAYKESSDPGRFIAEIKARINKTETAIRNDFRDGVEVGAEFMRERIIDIPRIDTWLMFNSVNTSFRGTNQHGARGSFGWVNRQEDYFRYQDQGTQQVVAMFALRDAEAFVRSVLSDQIGKRLRNG